MAMNDPNPWLSLSLGAVGTALGVFNAWRGWSRDRVALIAEISFYVLESGEHGIEVIVRNIGHIEAVIEGLGMQMRSGDIIRQPVSFRSNQTFPVAVGPKKSISFLFQPEIHDSPEMADVRRIVVETQCGKRFCRTSKTLKSAVRSARSKHVLR